MVSTVKSATRVLDVLELLAAWRRAMSHSEIAENLDIPKSSLTQLLRNMVARGYLSFDAANRDYLIGPKFGELVRRRGAQGNLATSAQAALDRLSSACGETALLHILVGDEVQLIARSLSKQTVIVAQEIGDCAAVLDCAYGRVILASMPKPMRDEYISRGFGRASLNKDQKAKAAKSAIESVLAKKPYVGHEDKENEVITVSTVILNATGFPVAALSVAIPAYRYNRELSGTTVPALMRAAMEIQQSAFGC